MSQNRKKNKRLEWKIPNYRNIFSYIMICIIFGGIFAVRLHVEELTGQSLTLFSNSDGLYADWFLYCKEVIYLICGVVFCLYFIGERIFPDYPTKINPILERKSRLPLILIGIYLLMSILSGVFSQNKEVVLWGMCNEFEGILGIFAYCVLFAAGYNFFTGAKVREFYKKAFFVLISVTVILAVLDYFFIPLLQMPFMKYVIAPEEYREAAENLSRSNTFREAVLMFYNSNYMGGFCSIIFPVSLYYIGASEKKVKKIIPAIVSVGAFAAGIMSNSTAAFYVMIAEGIFIFLLFAIKKVISLKGTAVILGTAATIAALGVVFPGSEFVENIRKSATNSGTYSADESLFRLEEIKIQDNSVVFKGKKSGAEYKVTPPFNANEKLEVEGIGNTIFEEKNVDSDHITIKDVVSGSDIDISLINGVMYMDFGYKTTVDFAVTTDGVKAIVQQGTLIDKIPQGSFNSSSWSDYYSLATGRGYIGLNSLPVLKECLIIGKGAGNFPFYFTQNDIAGLLETNGTSHIIVDKPHNWYLQIGVTTGAIGLLAILILFGGFVLICGRRIFSFRRSDYLENRDNIFLMCLYTGLLGFMAMGLVNDSIMSVNPFFWFNFGLAYSWSKDCGKEAE